MTHKMRTISLIMTILFLTIAAGVLLLHRVEIKEDESSLASHPSSSSIIQETPRLEGPTILQSHCAQCHDVQWLEQIQKTRQGWEQMLIRMEGMGVHLSDQEKVVLLNYLAVADNP